LACACLARYFICGSASTCGAPSFGDLDLAIKKMYLFFISYNYMKHVAFILKIVFVDTVFEKVKIIKYIRVDIKFERYSDGCSNSSSVLATVEDFP
jgi:hypothetical protein